MININKEILDLMGLFPDSFINRNLELILIPKENIYFRLEDVKTSEDLKCKFIAYLSRPSCKETSPRIRKYCLEQFNRFLGTTFSSDEMMKIYERLGNDCNRDRTRRFIREGYDLSTIARQDAEQ